MHGETFTTEHGSQLARPLAEEAVAGIDKERIIPKEVRMAAYLNFIEQLEHGGN
jgi:hypothetical protein